MTGFGTNGIGHGVEKAAVEETGIRHVFCDDLDAKIESLKGEGFRLNMIMPADAPLVARMSRGDEYIYIAANASSRTPQNSAENSHGWIEGRAGMLYRDLIPGRLGGELIASHIRLTEGGEVPDYVHYHRIRFQMIFCVRGAIEVVYEDQGPPFRLKPGDCVLQPPEIRHRVLWAEAGSEVVELGVPAIHETWVEHKMDLPTPTFAPKRLFSGQRFVRYIAGDHPEETNRDTGIFSASAGFAEVRVVRPGAGRFDPSADLELHDTIFCFVLSGGVSEVGEDIAEKVYSAGDALVIGSGEKRRVEARPDSELLLVGF